MKILVVGSGGREHALVWKISQSPRVSKMYCAPGNAGIAEVAQCVPIASNDLQGLLSFCSHERIDLTVVGPEQPLAEGLVDLFIDHGLAVFGPTKRAAELEWSKAFAKEFMQRYGIPTASSRVFDSSTHAEARALVETAPLPVVIKADGLAAGKGVLICRTRKEAVDGIEEMLAKKAFGSASERVVIEECLEGEEASIFAVTDGKDFITLAPAQDHKRVFDDDLGKNTGGMGAYAPAPVVTRELLQEIEEKITVPTLKGMIAEGRPYKGCLYVGLMLTSRGPKVIEFNSRFGDPETQVVLPLYDGDLVDLLLASCEGRVGDLRSAKASPESVGSAVCVVLASGGYPDAYATGIPVRGLDTLEGIPGIAVFHAGTKISDGTLATSGGRVLGITAILHQGRLPETIDAVYKAVDKVTFAGMHYRRDIGRKALLR